MEVQENNLYNGKVWCNLLQNLSLRPWIEDEDDADECLHIKLCTFSLR